MKRPAAKASPPELASQRPAKVLKRPASGEGNEEKEAKEEAKEAEEAARAEVTDVVEAVRDEEPTAQKNLASNHEEEEPKIQKKPASIAKRPATPTSGASAVTYKSMPYISKGIIGLMRHDADGSRKQIASAPWANTHLEACLLPEFICLFRSVPEPMQQPRQ